MQPQQQQATDYHARYLLLLGDHDAQRALLFTRDHRYLAELIDDDGLLLDNLMRAARACPPPSPLAARAEASAPATVQCYALVAHDDD